MNKFPLFVLMLVLFLAGCQSSHKEKLLPNVDQIPAIDSLINREINRKHIAGAVIRVQWGDYILQRKAYGYARIFNTELQKIDHPEKMTPEHMFDLASLTKVCGTTFGIMMLVDRGKIALDDPIYKWLPEFEQGQKKNITIRHLLTHSAGLYQWKPTYYHAANKQEQYQYIAGLPLKWEVGEGRHYSDLGFILLGHIIERISGEPLDQFLYERLYQPLNMQRTTFNPKEKGFKKIAATSHGNQFERHMVYDDSFGYDIDVDPESWSGWRKYTLQGEVNDGNSWYAAHGVAGHAGLFSTVDDLQKLVNLLLNKGKYNNEQFISSAVIDTFLTKDRFGNGLGWAMDSRVISSRGAPAGTFGHTGFTGTNILVLPEEQLSIILLTNREHVGVQPSGYYYNLAPLRQRVFSAAFKKVLK